MSKLRLQKQGDTFHILNEDREVVVGYIRPLGYEVVDHYSDEVAVVRSLDEAVAALAAHPTRWKSGGIDRYIKLTHEYCDSLEVEKTREGSWTALRNGYALGNENGPIAFPTALAAKSVADLHADDGHPDASCASDGLSWLPPSDATEEDEDRYRIEYQLGKIVADVAEAISRARAEHSKGEVKPETAEIIKVGIRRLREIRDTSSLGSYDTRRGERQPYFMIPIGTQADTPARASFEEAAHHYGKLALRESLGPGVSDTVLREMISQVLGRLSGPDRLARAA
jgi:hypothetical protein